MAKKSDNNDYDANYLAWCQQNGLPPDDERSVDAYRAAVLAGHLS